MQPSTATTSGQALQNLQGFQGTMQTPDQELSTENNALGVSQAQSQVQGLQGAINNTTNLLNQVAPSVEGRTQNSLVTSGQATKQISNEEAPIQATLSKDSQDYNTANSNYTNLETQAQNKANADEQAQTNQLSYLQNIYNDLYTQEQNTAAQQEAQAEEAEKVREFNASLGASSDSSDLTSQILASILGGQQSAAETNSSSGSSGGSSQPSLSSIFGNSAPKATKSTINGGRGEDVPQLVEGGLKAVGKKIASLF